MAKKESAAIDKEISDAEKAMMKSMKTLAKLRRKKAPEVVEDAVFEGPGGKTVRLSQLFGNKDELILVHNMGRSCTYCTLWADGLNGLSGHIENRAAFAIASPDDVEAQAKFANSRGWTVKMVRDPDGRFSSKLGYGSDGGIHPGVSTFIKHKDGRIERFASSPFGPGDTFMPVFHLFDLLPKGQNDWSPQYKYR